MEAAATRIDCLQEVEALHELPLRVQEGEQPSLTNVRLRRCNDP